MQFTECKSKNKKWERPGNEATLRLYLLGVGPRIRSCSYPPQEVTIGLLKAAMLSSPGAQRFLLDGFPGELQQGRLFAEQVYTKSRVVNRLLYCCCQSWHCTIYIIVCKLPNLVLFPKVRGIVTYLEWEWNLPGVGMKFTCSGSGIYLEWEWNRVPADSFSLVLGV